MPWPCFSSSTRFLSLLWYPLSASALHCFVRLFWFDASPGFLRLFGHTSCIIMHGNTSSTSAQNMECMPYERLFRRHTSCKNSTIVTSGPLRLTIGKEGKQRSSSWNVRGHRTTSNIMPPNEDAVLRGFSLSSSKTQTSQPDRSKVVTLKSRNKI